LHGMLKQSGNVLLLRPGYYAPLPTICVASLSHFWVCSSVHPGTANPLLKRGSLVKPGPPVKPGAVIACLAGGRRRIGRECRTGAASAVAQSIKAPKTKIHRIVTLQVGLFRKL
jgi:hypothetical protein